MERGEEAAFEQHRRVRRGMIDRGEPRGDGIVTFAAGDADRALRRGGEQRRQIECDASVEPKPVESGGSKQRRVGLAVRNFRQPRRDITTQRHDDEIGALAEHLRRAARRRRAEPRAAGQGIETGSADQPVADVGARQHRRDRDPVGEPRLDVLHRMNCKVDPTVEQRRVEFLGPQRLAADFGKRAVLHAVAGGDDDDDLDRNVVGHECIADHVRLRQRERRSARPEFERIHRAALCKRRRRLARRAVEQNGAGEATGVAEPVICRDVTIPPLILGIESSCDETAVALVCGDRTIVAQAVASQDAAHRPFGGVVPEIAARAHVEVLTPMIARVLAEGGVALADVDAIAATAGPGLIGGVMVGLATGKALAFAANKPLLAINHLEGHALSPRLIDPDLAFPYLLLLVSGGHCQLLAVDGVARYRRLATTIDDAVGEAFDKVAKLLGLGFPGGPAVEMAARTGDATRFKLPRPLLGAAEPHFSFAGLKSAVLRARDALPAPISATDAANLAAGFQAAVVDCLLDRTTRAMVAMPEATALVVAGGVAANGGIRGALTELAKNRGLKFVAPPLWLCTDNAAMIAWAGAERLALGLVDGLDAIARPRWPLDSAAEPVRGAGVKA
jgi:N6-L-threonylcarbamoyladenine synthase